MPIELIKETSSYWPSTDPGPQKVDKEKLKKACMDFESIFIHQLLKSMRQTVPKSGLLGEGPEKGIFESLFDQELSKTLTHQGGLGLGKMLYQQMLPPEGRRPPSSIGLKAPLTKGNLLKP